MPVASLIDVVTDATNASRTLLMDLRTLAWSQDCLDVVGVPRAMLPAIRSSSEVYGEIRGGPLAGVPIAGALGDQQAALFGQACFEPGEAKVTLGTGAFLLANTGEAPVVSRHGLLSTIAWQLADSIRSGWEGKTLTNREFYAAGTWGPVAADEMFAGSGRSWREPLALKPS